MQYQPDFIHYRYNCSARCFATTIPQWHILLPGSSLKIGYNHQFKIVGSTDAASGVSGIECTIAESVQTFTPSSTQWLRPSTLNASLDGTSVVMRCYSYDQLSNDGSENNFNLSFDFILPNIEFSWDNIGQYMFPDSEISAACSDTSAIGNFDFEYQLNQGNH